MTYTLVLPYPVSANRYWRHFGNRPIVSSEAMKYKIEIAAIAELQGVVPLQGDVRLDLVLFAKKTKKDSSKRPRCIDLSNSLKVTEDALIGIAYDDDAQTRQITMAYGEPVFGGAVQITISQILF